MKEQMMLVVEAMRMRVDENLTSIRATEQKIRLLLKEPVSDKRSKDLEALFAKNRKLLEENKVALAIQLNILDYIRFYGEILENSMHSGEENESNSANANSSKEADSEDSTNPYVGDDSDEDDFIDEDEQFDEVEYDRNIFFENVTKGKSVYNEHHLFWEDEEFFLKLLNFYIQEENYEACAKLKEARKKL